jgi:transcriptional regulator with XRE-family HTH domain
MLLTDRHQKLATDAPRWWRTFQFPLAPWGWQSANLCDNRGTMPKYRHYLREWRQKRGLTQEQVAEAMGTHRGMISRYESSQRGLTLEVQFRLMEVLDIMPAQFFSPPDEPSLDTMLRDASPDDRQLAHDIIQVFLRKYRKYEAAN